MRTAIAAAFFALFCTQSVGCINSYKPSLATAIDTGDRAAVARMLDSLEQNYAHAATIETSNDLAVAYIFLGAYEKAIRILLALEKAHPGTSRAASNLGTALELSGKNTQALQWIKKGIARNPEDHAGTEWLHVKILEAKIALAKDPRWLQTRRVLGMSFGEEERPTLLQPLPKGKHGYAYSLAEIEAAIDYQMKERLKFVSPPEPIVGDLFFARAEIAEITGSVNPADFYEAALRFGASNEALIKRRLARIQSEQGLRSKGLPSNR